MGLPVYTHGRLDATRPYWKKDHSYRVWWLYALKVPPVIAPGFYTARLQVVPTPRGPVWVLYYNGIETELMPFRRARNGRRTNGAEARERAELWLRLQGVELWR